ncbi:MAG: hypothetical protein HZA69_02030, partial [Gammaproteobacteria bacterium]|nr:hypothetical protein [Gammaproteobacteria bacterium]
MMQPEDIKRMIESGLPGARVSVTGDGHHFDARHPWRAPLRGALKRVQFCSGQNCEAEVISSEFVGKTMLQQ